MLLGRLEYIETECNIRCIDKSKRRYVKPIHCVCAPEDDGCASLEAVDPNEQDFSTQLMIIADNYNQLSRNISEQQSQVARWGEDLQKVQQAYFQYQESLAEEALGGVQQAAEKSKEPAKKSKVGKGAVKKKPGRQGKE